METYDFPDQIKLRDDRPASTSDGCSCWRKDETGEGRERANIGKEERERWKRSRPVILAPILPFSSFETSRVSNATCESWTSIFLLNSKSRVVRWTIEEQEDQCVAYPLTLHLLQVSLSLQLSKNFLVTTPAVCAIFLYSEMILLSDSSLCLYIF